MTAVSTYAQTNGSLGGNAPSLGADAPNGTGVKAPQVCVLNTVCGHPLYQQCKLLIEMSVFFSKYYTIY